MKRISMVSFALVFIILNVIFAQEQAKAMDTVAAPISTATWEQEVIHSQGLVLVNFWTSWSDPCKMVEPTVDAISNEYEGRMKVFKIDVNENSNLSRQYQVESVPTLMFFKNGQKVAQIVGAIPKADLEYKVDALLAPETGQQQKSTANNQSKMTDAVSILLVALIILVPVVLWIIALVDIIMHEFTGSNKIIWLLAVIFVPLIGMVFYFFIGRSQRMINQTGAQTLSDMRFCPSCGDKIDGVEKCAKCGTARSAVTNGKRISWVKAAIAVVVVLLIIGGIIAAIAIPQFSDYRMRGYNQAAESDLRNTSTCLEAFLSEHNAYPNSLEEGNCRVLSDDVTLTYNIEQDGGFTLMSQHKSGDKIYAKSSREPEIYFKDKNESAASFRKL